ncbi:MAG: hypothetical protein GY708_15730 [Actinomycetia bacterium]|nr:hypothetical protein [Actinomycetes bacterium]MCP4960713.1 hypothetical protein [Actinomycetes bacterium]
MNTIDHAIDRGALDDIIRSIDGLCEHDDWNEVLRVAFRCRRAHERGHQLWPAAMYAEYRAVLGAPPATSARVASDSPGIFSLGPLCEVAAFAHLWPDIDPHLPDGPIRTQIAAEAVVRGDVVDPSTVDLELPGALQGWEPDYDLAEYSAEGVVSEAPLPPHLSEVTRGSTTALRTDEEVELALRDLVAPWLSSSEGACATVSIHGPALGAVAVLTSGPIRAARIEPGLALRVMAWAGASGGAQGRRRGAAAGRAGAWHAVAALGGDSTWPPNPDDIGEWVEELEWWWWDSTDEHKGWRLRLAVRDPAHDLAWAIDAHDHKNNGGAQD